MNCPNCHNELESGVKFCRHCGVPIPKEVVKYCEQCKLDYPQEKKFCRECGSPLLIKSAQQTQQFPPPQPSQHPPKNNTAKFIFGTLGMAVLTVAIIVVLKLFVFKESPEEANVIPSPIPFEEMLKTNDNFFSSSVGAWSEPRLERTLKTHKDYVWTVDVGPESQSIVSGSADKSMRVWGLKSGNAIINRPEHDYEVRSVKFSPDGSAIYSAGFDGILRKWRFPGAFPDWKSHLNNTPMCLAVSADSKMIACAMLDGEIKLYDPATGEEMEDLSLKEASHYYGVDFHPSGRWCAVGGAEGNIMLWDIQSGILNSLHHIFFSDLGQVNYIQFSPDGKLMASAHGVEENSGGVAVWFIEEDWKEENLIGHTKAVNCVAFSPDSKILASGAKDNSIILWDMESGNKIHEINEHDDMVMELDFSKDGTYLVSGSNDGTIKVWRRKN